MAQRKYKGLRALAQSRSAGGFGSGELIERSNVFLPVLAIEPNNLGVFACEVIVIENSDVYSVKIRRSPGPGEDVNATGFAEVMFCDPGPEPICAKLGIAG